MTSSAYLCCLNEMLSELITSEAVFWECRPNRYQSEELTGDWKHTHCNIDNLVEQFYGSMGIKALTDHEYVDDTGEDWGTAYHSFMLDGNASEYLTEHYREGFNRRVAWYDVLHGRKDVSEIDSE